MCTFIYTYKNHTIVRLCYIKAKERGRLKMHMQPSKNFIEIVNKILNHIIYLGPINYFYSYILHVHVLRLSMHVLKIE